MKLLVRRTVMITALLAIAAAVVYAFLPRPAEVEMDEVRRGPLQVTVNEEGKTRVRQRYTIAAPIAGQLQRIALQEGDAIQRDATVLAAIAPSDPAILDVRARAEAEARVRQAEAAIQRAQALQQRAAANLEFARSERERLSQAFENSAASRREYESAVTNEQVAQQELRSEEFGLQMAQFELQQAQAAFLRTQPQQQENARDLFEIRAPIDGRVFRVLQKSAAPVQPGAALIEVGDPNDLEIVIDVLSTDAVNIRPGAAVIIERWGGATPLKGVVRLVEPSGFTKVSALGVEEQRVNVVIDFQPPQNQASSIGDNFRVEGRIVTWESDAVVKAPTSALFRTGNDWSVFVIQAGRASLRRIEIGHQNGLEAEVLSGLEAGDRVILHPSDRIRDGVRVKSD